jgi:hypothetical protein
MWLLAIATTWAQSIEIPWTARLLRPEGAPFQGPVAVELRLYPDPTGVIPRWTELFNLSAEDGFVSVRLGAGSHPLEVEHLQGDTHIEVWVNGGQLGARERLSDVPSAAIARSVATAPAPPTPDCPGQDGAIVVDTELGGLRVCVDATWKFVALSDLPTSGGGGGAGGFARFDRLPVTPFRARVFAGEPSFGIRGGINPQYVLAPEPESGGSGWSFLSGTLDIQFSREFRDTSAGVTLVGKDVCADDDRTYWLLSHSSGDHYLTATSHDAATTHWTYKIGTGSGSAYHGLCDVDLTSVSAWFGPNGGTQTFLRLDKATGAVQAQTRSSTSLGFINSLVAHNGTTLAQTEYQILALDADGHVLWDDLLPTGHAGVGFATDGDSIYFVHVKDTDQWVYVSQLDPDTGAILNQREYNSGNNVNLKVAGNSGDRVVLTPDGQLFAALEEQGLDNLIILSIDLTSTSYQFHRADPSGSGRFLQALGMHSDHGTGVVLFGRRIESSGAQTHSVLTMPSTTPGAAALSTFWTASSAPSSAVAMNPASYAFVDYGAAGSSPTVTALAVSVPSTVQSSW